MDRLLSVIIPVYNCEKYIERCIKSVLQQTYPNIEIIVVDDGSTDNSLHICMSLAEKSKNIHVFHKENEGVVSARKEGINNSKGDYIAFVDSDDWICPNMYEEMLNQAKGKENYICALTKNTVRKSHIKYECEVDTKIALSQLCLLEFPTSMWAYVYSARLVKDIIIPKDIHFFEDFLFNYLVLQKVERIYLCNQSLYHYTINDESVNHQGLTMKRLSCLNIIPLIENKETDKLMNMQDERIFAIAHFIVCNITVLSIKSERALVIKLKKVCKKYKKSICNSSKVPYSYKVAICVSADFISLMKIAASLKRR